MLVADQCIMRSAPGERNSGMPKNPSCKYKVNQLVNKRERLRKDANNMQLMKGVKEWDSPLELEVSEEIRFAVLIAVDLICQISSDFYLKKIKFEN